MAEGTTPAISAEERKRIAQAARTPAQPASADLTSMSLPVQAGGDVMRLRHQLGSADSASRAVAVSRLQRGHGNAAVNALLRRGVSKGGAAIATIQRQPPSGVAAGVRELSASELVDFVRRFPDRVLYSSQSNWLFDYAWQKGGGKGEVAAFEFVGEDAPTNIRVDGSRLSDEVRSEVTQTLRAHHGAKEAARAERAAAKAAERGAVGMAETPASPSALEGPAGGAEAKAGGTEAKAGGAEAKLAGAETELAGAEAKLGGVEAKGLKVESGAFKVAEEAAKAGRLARLGTLLLELGLPGPWDVFFMFIAAFGSIAEAKAQLRAEAFALGFGKGLSASLLNESPRDAMYTVASPSIGERVAGFEGVRERGSNAGVAAGYKFGQALNAKQRSGFLEKLRQELAARNTLRYLTGEFRRDSTDMGIALRPTVLKLLEEAARQEEERRIRQEMIRMSRKRPGEV